jgi:hypothetical protein
MEPYKPHLITSQFITFGKIGYICKNGFDLASPQASGFIVLPVPQKGQSLKIMRLRKPSLVNLGID